MKTEVYNNIVEIIRMVPIKSFPHSKECMDVLRLTYPTIPRCTLESIYALVYRRRMRERHRKLTNKKKQEFFERYIDAVKRGETQGVILRMSLEVGLSPALLARFILEHFYLTDFSNEDEAVKNKLEKFSKLSLSDSKETSSQEHLRRNVKENTVVSTLENDHNKFNSHNTSKMGEKISKDISNHKSSVSVNTLERRQNIISSAETHVSKNSNPIPAINKHFYTNEFDSKNAVNECSLKKIDGVLVKPYEKFSNVLGFSYNLPCYIFDNYPETLRDCLYGDMPDEYFRDLKWPNFVYKTQNDSVRYHVASNVQKPVVAFSNGSVLDYSPESYPLPSDSKKFNYRHSFPKIDGILRSKNLLQQNFKNEIKVSTTREDPLFNEESFKSKDNISNNAFSQKYETECTLQYVAKSFRMSEMSSLSNAEQLINNNACLRETDIENKQEVCKETSKKISKHVCHGMFGKNSIFNSWEDKFVKAIESLTLEGKQVCIATLSEQLKQVLEKLKELENRAKNNQQRDPYQTDELDSSVRMKDISRMMKDTTLIPDGTLAHEIFLCNLFDNQYGVISDICKSSVGVTYEAKLSELAKRANLVFRREDNLRDHGFDKTPDFILDIPVAVGENVICWIESKALFADEELHKEYCVDQYDKYCIRYGPGLVIYWFGFVEDIREQNPLILVRENFPRYIKYINYDLPEFLQCDLPELMKE